MDDGFRMTEEVRHEAGESRTYFKADFIELMCSCVAPALPDFTWSAATDGKADKGEAPRRTVHAGASLAAPAAPKPAPAAHLLFRWVGARCGEGVRAPHGGTVLAAGPTARGAQRAAGAPGGAADEGAGGGRAHQGDCGAAQPRRRPTGTVQSSGGRRRGSTLATVKGDIGGSLPIPWHLELLVSSLSDHMHCHSALSARVSTIAWMLYNHKTTCGAAAQTSPSTSNLQLISMHATRLVCN